MFEVHSQAGHAKRNDSVGALPVMIVDSLPVSLGHMKMTSNSDGKESISAAQTLCWTASSAEYHGILYCRVFPG